MPAQTAGQFADQLREAIARRAALRPGTAAHWRAVCDVKTLQRALVANLADDGGVPRRSSPASQGG